MKTFEAIKVKIKLGASGSITSLSFDSTNSKVQTHRVIESSKARNWFRKGSQRYNYIVILLEIILSTACILLVRSSSLLWTGAGGAAFHNNHLQLMLCLPLPVQINVLYPCAMNEKLANNYIIRV